MLAGVEWHKVLLVAGTLTQSHYWAREMGITRARWDMGMDAGSSFVATSEHWDIPMGTTEVFFVGTWGVCDVDQLARLWADIEYLRLPATFVCDWYGEVIEVRAPWFRWRALGSGRTTAWHLVPEYVNAMDEVRTACGFVVPTSVSVVEGLVRYGSPPAACGICAHESRKLQPLGSVTQAVQAMRMLRAQAARRRFIMPRLRWSNGDEALG